MPVKPLRERQAEATRNEIIAVARDSFTANGYAATSISEVIKKAGVAHGAVYHHFANKEALFRAVYETVEAEVVARVMQAAGSQTTPWESVRAGLDTFLDACLEPDFRRIVVLESVSVLHAEMMNDDGELTELPMLRDVLEPLLGTSAFANSTLEPLAFVALGGLYGASLYIARSADPDAAREAVDDILDTLVAGLVHGTGSKENP